MGVLNVSQVGVFGRLPKNFTTASRPETTLGLCWMYRAVSHLSAWSQWLHWSRSFMMWSAACLFACSFGSLSEKSVSGFATPLTGSCVYAGATVSEASNRHNAV